MKKRTLLMAMLLLLLTACGFDAGQVMDGDGMLNHYTQISVDEAKRMMAEDDGHLIVDVRTREEYEAGHIPGAICVPNESIADEPPEALPDQQQILLIYCRSGRRSKEAAQKLFDMGYVHVYEFGGILDWDGEVVTEDSDTSAAIS